MRNSMFVAIIAFICNATVSFADSGWKTEQLSFVFEGKTLSGFLDTPCNDEPHAIVIIVPGYGKTNFESSWYYDSLRLNFVRMGLACFLWDKAGCGRSEGVFNAEQPVENSAKEVLSAIKTLKAKEIPGSDRIGLWGISRAGWICPLVIQQYPQIAFWISVSGTDEKENFGYLLESNFLVEGKTKLETRQLVSEWKNGYKIFTNGGSFEAYQQATKNLRQNDFWINVSGESTQAAYEQNQREFIKANHRIDKKSGLMIYIENFPAMLKDIKCPVLAIFGEKDTQVDWRMTSVLYRETIGGNSQKTLTIKSLKDANHSIISCQSGGFREKIENGKYAPGYFETMASWTRALGITSR